MDLVLKQKTGKMLISEKIFKGITQKESKKLK